MPWLYLLEIGNREYPEGNRLSDDRVIIIPDVSRRDWLAGMAMQGMVANPTCDNLDDARIAMGAYRMADAMIAESDRKEPEST